MEAHLDQGVAVGRGGLAGHAAADRPDQAGQPGGWAGVGGGWGAALKGEGLGEGQAQLVGPLLLQLSINDLHRRDKCRVFVLLLV